MLIIEVMDIHSGNHGKWVILMFFLVSVILLFTVIDKVIVKEPEEVKDTSFSMGTAVTTTLYGSNSESAAENLAAVSRRLTEVDNHISWRIENSLTALFNQQHEVSLGDYEEVYQFALDVARESGGAFDPTILAVSKIWDFGGEHQRRPSAGEIAEALKNVDYKRISLSGGVMTAKDSGLVFELGAIGKGYALEQAAAQINKEEISGGILNAGSSILTFGTKPDGSKFRVGLRDPRGEQDDLIGIFNLTDTSVSTSGDYEKYFEEDGKRYHHILDARTGEPADSGLMSVTVISDNSTLCDALSTAAFILGLDEGMKLLENYGVMGIFVDNQRNVYYNNESILDILSFDGEKQGYTLKPYYE